MSSAISVLLIAIAPSALSAQTPLDTLPCDSWLTTLAAGATSSVDREVLYEIDRCVWPDSVVLAAREQGTVSLLLRGETGWASVYLGYLERDALWVANSMTSFVLPFVIDKAKSQAVRGLLMLVLANALQPRDAAMKAVYVQEVGETPGTIARCTQGLYISERSATRLSLASINAIKSAAQAMIADRMGTTVAGSTLNRRLVVISLRPLTNSRDAHVFQRPAARFADAAWCVVGGRPDARRPVTVRCVVADSCKRGCAAATE